eukprot:scaffold25122_cov66-Phaeocystis_antarctica.AAC.10
MALPLRSKALRAFLPGHGEATRKGLHLLAQHGHAWLTRELLHEVHQLGPGALLHRERELDCLVEHLCHLLEVLLSKAARGECRGAEAHAPRCRSILVAVDCVLIERDRAGVA